MNIFEKFAPAGHFYSPLPDLAAVKRKRDKLFDRTQKELPGINVRDQEQRQLLDRLCQYYGDLPFKDERQTGLRYFYNNSAYNQGDAFMLYAMIRHWRPRRIIEVGSGYSSAATLDTNELFLENKIDCTFIEPYPELLFSRLKPDDRERHNFIDQPLQEIDLKIFNQLAANDILFIDSTHVAKIGSDVNYLLFEILPRLQPGVIIHIHDIIFPFEYPEDWVMSGRAWNEAYLLRAFLQFNHDLKL
ncbi:MAG: class I SAM-dependent methyltransferase [Patescibacteria group bacterium]